MPERITRDTGMMERRDIRYRMDDPRELDGCIAAFKAWADSFPVAEPDDWPGDALHRHNAERCRAILATVGMADDGKCAVNTGPLREKGLAENSAQWIAAHWLAEYNALKRGREWFEAGDQTPDNLSRMLMATEEMGRLQERMWWRSGVDPQTGAPREDLALAGRSNKKALKTAGEETAKKHESLRKKRFKRMAELIPVKKSVEKAARECEAEGLGGWQGIKKQWDRHKENRDT